MTNIERFSDPEASLDDVRNYFQQGIILKDQIVSMQLQTLTVLSYSLGSPGNISVGKVQTSPAGEAAFKKKVEKKDAMEERLRRAIQLMIDLKQQISIKFTTVFRVFLIIILTPFPQTIYYSIFVLVCLLYIPTFT